ncbi:hypothetical protein [Streptomyces chrestomyceticus]|uniref:hypothetical protein n=1 Tax=Streptomyces chrestomyceticus TaxID=68185 RepID=UPI0033C9925A
MIAHVHRAKGPRTVGARLPGERGPFGTYPDPERATGQADVEDDDQADEEPAP